MSLRVAVVSVLLALTASISLASEQLNCRNTGKIDTKKTTTYIHQIKTLSQPDKGKLYERLYNSCTQTKQIVTELNNQELDTLYESIFGIVFYTNNIVLTDYMREVFDESVKRGEKNKRLLERMHRTYVQTRQFKQGSQLEQQFPDAKLSPIPYIVSEKVEGRSLLHIVGIGQKLVQKPFELPNNGHIVVVSSPMCNPSRRYLSWLKTKPQLLSIFAKHATWIIPTSGYLYVNEVMESNKKNAPVEMQYTYKESDWPEIDYWGTPTLYFYHDGELKQQLVGWPREGREKQLKEALRNVGLLKQEA